MKNHEEPKSCSAYSSKFTTNKKSTLQSDLLSYCPKADLKKSKLDFNSNKLNFHVEKNAIKYSNNNFSDAHNIQVDIKKHMNRDSD